MQDRQYINIKFADLVKNQMSIDLQGTITFLYLRSGLSKIRVVQQQMQ